MTAPLPTIILVHGAWSTPAIYQPYITALEAAGFTVHCPRLPSCSGVSPPTASFTEDVACVQTLLHSLTTTNPGQRILLIMHSYGGAVGTDAVSGLLATNPSAQASIVHLLYLCAYILVPGSCVWDIVEEAGVAPLWSQYVDDGADGLTFLRDPEAALFNEMSPAEAAQARTELVRWPASAMRARTRGDAWAVLPATYVLTKQDRTVPSTYQEIMLGKVAERGVAVRREEFDTGHSVFITLRDEMVRAAVRATRDERNAA
ncbi:alpha/beta-hydrolase [Whalleya microplaca]|nr:alpha/beta-hydrolase [Whalleya microplaca]